MASEKNDSIVSTKIKTVAVKRRMAEPKVENEQAKDGEKLPKKSQLAVRIVSRDFKLKEMTADKETEKAAAGTTAKEKKGKKEKTSQKDYFHRASHKIGEAKEDSSRHGKAAGKKKHPQRAPGRSVGLYRKIFVFFIILTLALLAAAFYFFFVSLTVEVTPKNERVSDKMNITIVNAESGAGAAALSANGTTGGLVEQIPVKEEKTYSATGAEILGQEIIGTVTVVNNYTQSQALVATTRLLSPDDKLFRIKDKITIPAGGSADVQIYSDEPSQEMAIGPSDFTIPGLRAGLQDKIYAKSKTAFVYQTQVKKFVQAIDIEKAKQDLKETLVKEIGDQFSGNYKGFDKVITEIDKDSLVSSSSAKANAKVGEFVVSLKANVNIIAFKSANVEKLAEDKLISVASGDKKIVSLDRSKMAYNLLSADFKSLQAVLEIAFTGAVALSDPEKILDKEKLIGLNEAQITQYLKSLDKFSDFKLIFRPPFFKKAPSLMDRIKIIIK